MHTWRSEASWYTVPGPEPDSKTQPCASSLATRPHSHPRIAFARELTPADRIAFASYNARPAWTLWVTRWFRGVFLVGLSISVHRSLRASAGHALSDRLTWSAREPAQLATMERSRAARGKQLHARSDSSFSWVNQAGLVPLPRSCRVAESPDPDGSAGRSDDDVRPRVVVFGSFSGSFQISGGISSKDLMQIGKSRDHLSDSSRLAWI